MRSTISAGYRTTPATDRRTLAGSILFAGLVIAIMLAAFFPRIAAAAALGAISAHAAHRVARWAGRGGLDPRQRSSAADRVSHARYDVQSGDGPIRNGSK